MEPRLDYSKVLPVIINTWNRFAITFRDEPGSYQSHHFATEPGQAAPVKVSE